MNLEPWSVLVLLGLVVIVDAEDAVAKVEEEKYGVKYADKCEVCKYVTIELAEKMKETGKSSANIETGYSFDDRLKTKIKYKGSELRLIESLDGVCDRLLEYNVHKERSDSSRFAKGMSQTFQTLHGLVDKGVKVDLGIPYDLWNNPSAEITQLKTQCEHLLEEHEEDIENWFFSAQEQPLYKYLCIDRVLKRGDAGCLDEVIAQDKTGKDGRLVEGTDRKSPVKSGYDDNEEL